MKQFFKALGTLGSGLALLMLSAVVAIVTIIVALLAWLLVGDWAFIAVLAPIYIGFVALIVSKIIKK